MVPRRLGLWTFIDVEHQSYRICGGNFCAGRLHVRKLMSVCREQFADNDHSVLQLFLIESAYYREPDFLIFQRAMNICFADRLNPFVLDPANNWLLYNSENYDFSAWLGGAIFDLQA